MNQTTTYRCRQNPMTVAASVLCLLISIHAGCATMTTSQPETPPMPSAGSYKVIFGSHNGKAKIFDGQVVGNLTIQDALEQSGATRKFKGMRVDLARRVKEGNVLKMEVHFDEDSGKVIEEWNYAVHPGDEILVRPDNQGMLGTVLDSMQNSVYR